MQRRERTPWTPEQIARLREMRERGLPLRVIAPEVQHALHACGAKALALGIRPRNTTPTGRLSLATRAKSATRPCLCCRKPFLSEGHHNRLCPACRRENSDTVFTVTAGPHS